MAAATHHRTRRCTTTHAHREVLAQVFRQGFPPTALIFVELLMVGTQNKKRESPGRTQKLWRRRRPADKARNMQGAICFRRILHSAECDCKVEHTVRVRCR
jgi:hypothetical protein